MKQILSVLSNTHYTQDESDKEFVLKPMMELIIVYADGKNHTLTSKGLKQEVKCSEVRMIVSPYMLQALITELQLHKKKLDAVVKNADQLSSLVRHISNDEDNEKK